MIKNIVHYVGFLMLLVFMTGSTVYAENNIKNSQFSSNDIVPDINQTLITSIIAPDAPVTKQQLFMVLFRQVNVCQATMINLGKNCSISLATIKNIDPDLPVIAQLTTLLNITKQRYMQLVQMEGSLVKELKPYAKNAKFYWCQEEPKNMGAWFSVRDYIQWTLDNIKVNNNKVSYIGRSPDASPATGYAKRHVSQQQEIIKEVFE